MRAVRPTIRVLKQLPCDLFDDPVDAAQIASGNPEVLQRIDQISHPVLNAARAALRDGRRCEPHQSSTKTARQTVHEIEEKSSGWRGGVIIDDAGDPWLVHIDKHDKFHSMAATVLNYAKKDRWGPGPADYEMRKREDHVRAGQEWKMRVTRTFLTLVTDAQAGGCTATAQLPPIPRSAELTNVQLSISLDHDDIGPEIDVSTAHTSYSMANITVRILGKRDQLFQDMLMTVLVPLLTPEIVTTSPAYLPNNRGLVYIVTITKADLIQLVALLRADGQVLQDKITTSLQRTHRHYLRDDLMSDKMIGGDAARTVCGEWLVPIHDAISADHLPLCQACDKGLPVAQKVLDAIRALQKQH